MFSRCFIVLRSFAAFILDHVSYPARFLDTGPKFAWSDGVFLKALRAGDWVLLDELNLAPQSVLEGLNACLDHRATVYIPEINKCVPVHAPPLQCALTVASASQELRVPCQLSCVWGPEPVPTGRWPERAAKVVLEQIHKGDIYRFIICARLLICRDTLCVHAGVRGPVGSRGSELHCSSDAPQTSGCVVAEPIYWGKCFTAPAHD